MVAAVDKRSLAISRLCVPIHGLFAFALLLQTTIFVSYHDDHSDPRRNRILEILIITLTLSVLLDIVGVLVVGFNLFSTEEERIRVGRWIVPLHAGVVVEEVVILVVGLMGGNAFRGIWAIMEFDGGGGVTIALLGFLLLTDLIWVGVCWRWGWESVRSLAHFPRAVGRCGNAAGRGLSRIGKLRIRRRREEIERSAPASGITEGESQRLDQMMRGNEK
ncbi:hypothetical protein BDZ45DRAFT_726364 [Acephala macrosclerotiorum]|nr:hypothetical protein BDZ45DRAFT_726364 [Acephala macrosclerotiorum]